VIEARDLQRPRHLLGLPIVDVGCEAEQASCDCDPSSHAGVAGPRLPPVVAGVAHTKLTRRRGGRRFEQRTRPAITRRRRFAGPLVLGGSYPLARKWGEAERVDREVPAVCPAPQLRERESRTRLAGPLLMALEPTRTITRNGMRAPIDAQNRPELAIALGYVRSAHERPRPAAAVVRE
jgi:hypothetical protein